jgi:hypothetical protein
MLLPLLLQWAVPKGLASFAGSCFQPNLMSARRSLQQQAEEQQQALMGLKHQLLLSYISEGSNPRLAMLDLFVERTGQ